MTSRDLTDPGQLSDLAYDDEGLVPVVAQDVVSGRVLMLAWANREALALSLDTGAMHYWSRSRAELWRKGATSGNVQRVVSLHVDCDGDTVLARVETAGPACHTGDVTCFGSVAGSALDELWQTMEARRTSAPESSYTARLLADENLRTKKLGEEVAELIHALARGERDVARAEGADLAYHLLTALMGADVTLEDVLTELRSRRNRPRGTG